MATIKYLLRSDNGTVPIYLRLSVKKNNVFKRKTGLQISKNDWSQKTSLPKQTTPTNKNLSIELNRLSNKIYERLNGAMAKGVDIDAHWLEREIDLHFNRIRANEQSDRLIDAINNLKDNAKFRRNAQGGIGLSKSRLNSYKALLRLIKEFQGTRSIRVKEVDLKFSKDFLKFLLEDKKYQKSYAFKKLADLKTVCMDAETNGVEVSPQLRKIKSSKIGNEFIVYLNEKELKQIEDVELEHASLRNARKWLLLGCHIGQRGGDLLKITESNFVNRSGLEVIELKQQKTGKFVTIPVLDKTRSILMNGLPYTISIQKFNEHIKTICENAGIDTPTTGKKFDPETKRKKIGTYPKHQLMASHVCRRTFATNLYGILPTPLIMQITAHSTEKMLLNYIGKDGVDYAQQIADFYTLQAQKKLNKTHLSVVKNDTDEVEKVG